MLGFLLDRGEWPGEVEELDQPDQGQDRVAEHVESACMDDGCFRRMLK